MLTPHARGLTIAIEGLNYDHEAAAAKLIAAGLPQPYATALRGGPLPNRDTLPGALRARAGQALSFDPVVIDPARA